MAGMGLQESIANGRVWREGLLVDDSVTLDELGRDARDDSALLWIDLVSPDSEALRELGERLGLAETTLEDAVGPHERPKVTRHTGHMFFTVYAAELGDDTEDPGEGHLVLSRISGVVLPHALVTIRLDDRLDLAPVVAAWEENPELLAAGVGALVHGLLDRVVDGHFAVIQELDDVIEGFEDALFAQQHTDRGFLRLVYGFRKDLVALRRIVLPMREVVNGLLRHSEQIGLRESDRELVRRYDDLYDHVLRAAEWTESLRDMVTSVFETNLSLADTHLNEVMKKLAGWAAIIAVPTAITGWFGQNIPYPGFQQPFGLLLSVLLIAACSLALYAVFKRRGWL